MKQRLTITGLVLAGALALAAAGCGGDDGGGKPKTLDIKGNAAPFAGPAPLRVKFSATTKGGSGTIGYHWRFDDGTSSYEQNPTHEFPRPGYYTVSVEARDETGAADRQGLLLGSWPPQQWASAQRLPLTKQRARRTQRVQQGRTQERRREEVAAARRKLEQLAAGSPES